MPEASLGVSRRQFRVFLFFALQDIQGPLAIWNATIVTAAESELRCVLAAPSCRFPMRAGRLILVIIPLAGLLPALAAVSATQDTGVPLPPQTETEKAALFHLVLTNQKKSDEAMNLYERVERVEAHKNGVTGPSEVKVSRVIPAGTGVDHIPIGADGKPPDPDAYHAELLKLEHALSWAADDGHAQNEAFDKIAKRQKERDDLIDATRTAFIFTFVSTETRDGRVLYKYSMEPNPAYKAISRATSIFQKVRGLVWIDPAAGQLARVEGEVTGDITVGLFLAKVYKGSHFLQERHEMLPGLWMPTFSQYDFDGRKLFSSISIHERTFYSQYRRIGPPKQALAVIRAELGKAEPGVANP